MFIFFGLEAKDMFMIWWPFDRFWERIPPLPNTPSWRGAQLKSTGTTLPIPIETERTCKFLRGLWQEFHLMWAFLW